MRYLKETNEISKETNKIRQGNLPNISRKPMKYVKEIYEIS